MSFGFKSRTIFIDKWRKTPADKGFDYLNPKSMSYIPLDKGGPQYVAFGGDGERTTYFGPI